MDKEEHKHKSARKKGRKRKNDRLKSGEKDLIFEEDVQMDEVLEAAQKVIVGRAWGGSLRCSS